MEADIKEFIANSQDWHEESGFLVAGFEFKDFEAVQNVIQKIMKLADEQNHHPAVTFGYNTVEIKTVTHDAGNQITEKDFKLAEAISATVVGD